MRIAAVNQTGTDAELLAALGVTPTVASDTVDRAVWTTDALPATIETVYEFSFDDPYAFEAIAAAKPDLIIASDDDLSDAYDKLSAIAPVLGAPTTEGVTASWQERLTSIAQALDLDSAAQRVQSDYEAFFSKARADHPQFEGKTATYLVVYGGDYGVSYYSGTGSQTEALLVDLGLSPNPLATAFADSTDLSTELISKADADVLIVSDNSVEGGAPSEAASLLTDQPLYQELTAVKKGHAVIFENTGDSFILDGSEVQGNLAWALSVSGPLANRWAAGHLASLIGSVLD